MMKTKKLVYITSYVLFTCCLLISTFFANGERLFGELLFKYNIYDEATQSASFIRFAHNGGIVILGIALFMLYKLFSTSIKNIKNSPDLMVFSLILLSLLTIYSFFESAIILVSKSFEIDLVSIFVVVPIIG